MVSYNQLHSEIHNITELSNALDYLITDRSMCDNPVTNNVFFSFMDKAKKHLEAEDKEIYAPLLSKGDQAAQNIANKFLDGSNELKRLLDRHLRSWTNNKRSSLMIADHDSFVSDTRALTNLMLERIQDETEHLYPLIRNVTGNAREVA